MRSRISERQVVGGLLGGHHGRGRGHGAGGGGLGVADGSLSGEGRGGRGSGGSGGVDGLALPSADRGVPAAVVLAALDVEAQLDFLADGEGELVGALAEKVEMYLLGVSLLSLKHVLSLLPRVSSLAGAGYLGKSDNDFSCDFHKKVVNAVFPAKLAITFPSTKFFASFFSKKCIRLFRASSPPNNLKLIGIYCNFAANSD